MCGIFGMMGNQKSIDLKHVSELMAHRGPDDVGFFQNDFIALVHRRLSIIDVSSQGHQPMFSSCGNFMIIFNGEIYNHQSIRLSLPSTYTFVSSSDTETLLYAYIEYGEKVFQMLNGIFAFAIFDTKQNEIFIARDPFGIKPLYYHVDTESLVFSSEYKTLVDVIPGMTLDYHGILNYLYFLWSPGNKTPFSGVQKLLPGHFIRYNAQKQFSITKYFDIPFNGVYRIQSMLSWITEVELQLLKSVELQLLSDVPLGFFLSGGLDSSLLVAMACRIRPQQRWKCYTIGADADFANEGFAEDVYFARKVAQHLNVELIEVPAQIDLANDWDTMLWHLEEPQSDTAPLLVSAICAQAREDGCKVLISGAGGDDVFSGYRRHQSIFIQRWLRRIPFSRFVFSIIAKLFGANIPLGRRMQKLASYVGLATMDQRITKSFGWFELDNIKKLFTPEIQHILEDVQPEQYLMDSLANIPLERYELNRMLYLEMKYFLPDHNLNYTDKLSMAHGIEVRVPYLDKDLVQLSTQLPPALKMKGLHTKYILRKIAERYLPKEVIYRSKSGFGSPVRHLIKNELTAFVDDRLSTARIKSQGIFNPAAVQQFIEGNLKGKYDGSYIVLSLLAIESVVRQFMKSKTH